MRTIHGISICLGLGLVVLGARAAAAQEDPEVDIEYTPGFDPEAFAASADPDQISLVDGARTQAKGSLAIGIAFHFAGPELGICVRDAAAAEAGCKVEGDILTSRLRADLGVLYGFGRFDVRLALPLVLHQSTDFTPASGESPLGSAGVGDPRVAIRYQLARPGSLNIAADLAVAVPTGGEDFIGDHGLVIDPRVLFDVRRGRFGAGVNLGYRFRQESAKIADLYVDDEITWAAAAEYWLSPRKLAVGAAAYGRVGIMNAPADVMDPTGAPSEIGFEELPAEAMGSLRYFVSPRFAIDVGGGRGLTTGYGAAPFRVLAGLRWIDQKEPPVAPLVTDRDREGIDDDDDKCPKTAEDMDGFEDLDGCPEDDNDDDNVKDDADRCPLVAEDVDGFEDGDGCPDADNDGDGIRDEADICPGVAEDADGIKDGDGCPEGDDDDDGIPDDIDRCPGAAEDKDGLADTDGCPEDDVDADGLKDQDDRCPTEAEVFNDVDDADGCPDEGRTLAFVEGDAVVITEKIFFDVNRARIKTRSQPVLNAVAAILRAHADLKVSIEGHTDDQGGGDWNRKLSQLRSERVRDYLIKKGIGADRLEAKGFGSDRPLVRGTDEAARDRNRRVEFVIIGRTGAEPGPSELTP
jgi:outer membrane protein OmpA-like peptidoglycan-associated protein